MQLQGNMMIWPEAEKEEGEGGKKNLKYIVTSIPLFLGSNQ